MHWAPFFSLSFLPHLLIGLEISFVLCCLASSGCPAQPTLCPGVCTVILRNISNVHFQNRVLGCSSQTHSFLDDLHVSKTIIVSSVGQARDWRHSVASSLSLNLPHSGPQDVVSVLPLNYISNWQTSLHLCCSHSSSRVTSSGQGYQSNLAQFSDSVTVISKSLLYTTAIKSRFNCIMHTPA